MKIHGVVETAIYVTELDATEDFYCRILGLRRMSREAGRHVFFQAGDSGVLLAFLAATTLQGGVLPAHGATGPGHFALGIERDDFDGWRQHLAAHAIALEKEMGWPSGGQSLYFRDPAGNSVELITPHVWGLPSGW